MLSASVALLGLTRRVDIAIVGGGPCGLATALAISKARCLQGSSVEVFESDEFGPKGASLQISKPGWAALSAIDAEAADRIRRNGAPVTSVSLRSLGGASLTPAPVRAFMAVVGWLFRLLRRAGVQRGLTRAHLWHDVRDVLRERVVARGVVLRPSKTLVELREGADAVQLRFGDGDEVEAAVVLACDGTRSACRQLLPSEPDDLLVDENKSVWRGQARGLDTNGAATFYKDDEGRSGLVFPAGAGQGSSWTFISASVAGRSRSSDDARARLAAALPRKLVTRDFSKPWASAAPRVAFLGDAAHPLRPTGEGTALALEDAWTVGRLAASAATAEAFCAPATLRAYEASRRERVRAVSDAVRAAANRFYDEGSVEGVSPATRTTVKGAFEAHPILCTPL